MNRKNMDVADAAEYLEQIPKFSKEKHTIDVMSQMLRILGNPEKGQKIIHIAGTNGKGSVCAFLSSILREAGYSTAVFTSPHLLSIKERFSFNGENVIDEKFLKAFNCIKEALKVFEKEELGHPSYFEFLFLMFMMMVKEQPSDYVILETGLGGRLDATNAVEQPLVTVITSISLDHMEFLGNTVAKIAAEKAGIIKPNVPVVYDNTVPEASAVIVKKASEKNSEVYKVDSSSYDELSLEQGALSMQAHLLNGTSLRLKIPFAAEYQAVNSMLSVRAAELLGLSEEVIERGISQAVWPGRMEQIKQDVYLDGAHNEGGIREFAKAAKEIVKKRNGGRKILLFAVVSDKEYGEMAEILCREFAPDVLILTQIHYKRGLNINELELAARRAWTQIDGEQGKAGTEMLHDVRVIETVKEAFDEAMREKRMEDTVFCAGSLYLIGEIKEVLRRNEE